MLNVVVVMTILMLFVAVMVVVYSSITEKACAEY
jgi:hypothetical protein